MSAPEPRRTTCFCATPLPASPPAPLSVRPSAADLRLAPVAVPLAATDVLVELLPDLLAGRRGLRRVDIRRRGDLARVWLPARSSCAVQFGRHLGAGFVRPRAVELGCRCDFAVGRHVALGWLGAWLRRKE